MSPDLALVLLVVLLLAASVTLAGVQAAYHQARAERDALAAHLANVRRRHSPAEGERPVPICGGCRKPWPCPTYIAADYAPTMKEPHP